MELTGNEYLDLAIAVFVAWTSLIGALQLLVRITPSERDDRFVSRLADWTQKLRNVLTILAPSKSKDLKG